MDPLETFRTSFFALVEKEKLIAAQTLKRKQKTCFHKYELVENKKICKKCKHIGF